MVSGSVATSIVAHALDDLPQQLVALREVRLGKHAVLATAVASDPHEP